MIAFGAFLPGIAVEENYRLNVLILEGGEEAVPEARQRVIRRSKVKSLSKSRRIESVSLKKGTCALPASVGCRQ